MRVFEMNINMIVFILFLKFINIILYLYKFIIN
jgi:hypothetical protein